MSRVIENINIQYNSQKKTRQIQNEIKNSNIHFVLRRIK